MSFTECHSCFSNIRTRVRGAAHPRADWPHKHKLTNKRTSDTLKRDGCLPLGGIFRRNDIFFCLLTPLSANWSLNKRKCRSAPCGKFRLVENSLKQKEMSLRPENSALWKMALKYQVLFKVMLQKLRKERIQMKVQSRKKRNQN